MIFLTSLMFPEGRTMERSSNPFGPHSLYSLTRLGISRLQMSHQVAQNSSMTTFFPAYSDRVTVFPVMTSLSLKSGALSPIFRRMAVSDEARQTPAAATETQRNSATPRTFPAPLMDRSPQAFDSVVHDHGLLPPQNRIICPIPRLVS